MKTLFSFVVRLIINAFGLWLAIRMLSGGGYDLSDFSDRLGVFFMAALILAAVNMFIKPIVSIISLPATILTLGLFTIVINGLMVYLALWLSPGLEISFSGAIVASIVIGIVNFVVDKVLEVLKIK